MALVYLTGLISHEQSDLNVSLTQITMKILLTNDDGIDEPGLRALETSLSEAHEVWVVAPKKHMSGVSLALSLHSEFQIEKRSEKEWAVNGTPVDSVKFALLHIMKNEPPDILVSGINSGANLGHNIHYSGTVGAATEGALWDIPSIAVSICSRESLNIDSAAAWITKKIGEKLHGKILPGTLLNINLPDLPVSEDEEPVWTRMGKFLKDIPFRQTDTPGVFSYRTSAWLEVREGFGTDVEALSRNQISITMLDTDRTYKTK